MLPDMFPPQFGYTDMFRELRPTHCHRLDLIQNLIGAPALESGYPCTASQILAGEMLLFAVLTEQPTLTHVDPCLTRHQGTGIFDKTITPGVVQLPITVTTDAVKVQQTVLPVLPVSAHC